MFILIINLLKNYVYIEEFRRNAASGVNEDNVL